MLAEETDSQEETACFARWFQVLECSAEQAFGVLLCAR